jgi:hypothetical protein
MGDACGQYEIYYDTTFSTFGSQPKLISKIVPPTPHSSVEARKFYASPQFQKSCLFIGDTTHVENIKHLLPNHYIDIENQSVIRYFPNTPIKPISISEAVPVTIDRLKGFIKAASLRNKLAMGLTAGYDSRTLFLASLDVDCKYYVTKHPHMDDEHYEISVPKEVSKMFNKDFQVITEPPLGENKQELLEGSIDFPRPWTSPGKTFEDHLLINGNLSEIARNSYGRLKRVNKRDMANLINYFGDKFAQDVYGRWKEQNSKTIAKYGIHILDLFYWEQRMGLWAAKTKTEANAIGINIYSPFCSHDLLLTLLSTSRKMRNKYYNVLYNSIFKSISPEVSKIPINPSIRKRIYKYSHKMHFYRIIQRTKFIIKNFSS